MSANSKLISAGCVVRTRDQLAALTTPAATATWKPIPHADLVSAITEGLTAHGVEVTGEAYCTLGRADAKLLGTFDLRIPGLGSDDFAMGLGLRAGNDKTLAIQLVAACRIFVCSNWAFSGSEGAVFLKKRHTRRLDIASIVPGAVDQFLERAGAFREDIDRMRDFRLTDGHAKTIIHDLFARSAMPLRLFPAVSNLYFRDEAQAAKFPERSLYSLNNAATEALKRLKPAPQESSGIRVGRLFARLLHGGRDGIGAEVN
jgi:hypothetical protein